jgi:predicted nucleic acid-binding Zn ribbon protein
MFWIIFFSKLTPEILVKFCTPSELRLWRTGMLLLTKSKGHKSNAPYSLRIHSQTTFTPNLNCIFLSARARYIMSYPDERPCTQMIKSPSKIVQITRLMPMSQLLCSTECQFPVLSTVLHSIRWGVVPWDRCVVCSVAAHGAGRSQQFTVDSKQHYYTMVEKL